MTLRLGVNIDHVATIRNARGGLHPDPLRAVRIVEAAGGDGITVHLREDRRHIRDADLTALMAGTDLPVNLEMAATKSRCATNRMPPASSPNGARNGRPKAASTRRDSITRWHLWSPA
jgi:pyridoxine 5'-phosphate synthase PdxJ